MITYSDQHLLQARGGLLVNPVNCVGVMGAGVALRFKQAFPEMYARYRVECWRGEGGLLPGKAHLWQQGDVVVFNLPTKRHFKDSARLEYVELGLKVLHGVSDVLPSIVMPRIGCGLGGLKWEEVEPLVARWCPDATVYDGVIPPQAPWRLSGPSFSSLVGPS